jgi:transposase-like protein
LVVAAQIAARDGPTGSRRLTGWVEVDETYMGGLEEGTAGRGAKDKALIVIAAQADGKRIGRIRMRLIQDASAASLHPFVKDCIEPGSTVQTDGWQGYAGLKGFDHEVTKIRGRRKEASKLLPRVHLVASLLKRWLVGTHQGAVSHKHLPYYLDEFTFRFNRRRSKSRGKLFFRLLQQAAATGPITYSDVAKRPELLSSESQAVGAT